MKEIKANPDSAFLKNGERDRQRYRYIRYLAEMQGMTIRDLHRAFEKWCEGRSLPPCHFSVFYRVCQGTRRSDRVARWISRRLRTKHSELWV